MTYYYPVAIKLKNKSVLVAGGGRVAERKVKTLLKFGAKVRIVSPALAPALKKLLGFQKVRWCNRKVKSSDIEGADIVIAATGIASVNKKISYLAKKSGALVNVIDNAQLSTFISPAIFSKGKAIVAVYTNGRSPALSRDLKNFLKEKWDDFLSYRRRL